ncbi:MAG: ATP-binding protein [Cyanobacteriota bacterium]|nr:ATP-binding protein [Cyanobacteriota bacterium]
MLQTRRGGDEGEFCIHGSGIYRRYAKCFRSRKAISYEDCLTFQGECTWWLTTLNPLTNAEGQVYRLAGTTFNITDRKRAELQLHQKTQDLEKALKELKQAQTQLIQSEKMSSLGQLVAGVAHEINNPVNFIYGNLVHLDDYTQTLIEIIELYRKSYPQYMAEIEEEIDEIELDFTIADLPHLIRSMKVGTDRIKNIVLSLRTFSRMDEAEMKEVDLHDGIDSTLMILQSRLKGKPERRTIEVIKNYGNLPPVECYAGQLNQVFMNIFANAIDALETQLDTQLEGDRTSIFTPQIRIETQVHDDRWISICITDNGPGISEAVKQKLFDPFFTTKPVGKGTGMGLSISYQIITERHGGSLECVSQPGEGTSFSIAIPRRQD